MAPQPLAMQRLKRQNFHDAKLLEFSLSTMFFFLGRKTKIELKSLRQIYPPSAEVKEFLLFFHSLKSLFLLLRPLVSNWAIPTRCTTSASNRSRTSTVACPGDHVCKDIEYIGRKMCAYLQYINVYVYDIHIIEKNFQWEFSLESHGRCVGKQLFPLLNTWSFAESTFELDWYHSVFR